MADNTTQISAQTPATVAAVTATTTKRKTVAFSNTSRFGSYILELRNKILPKAYLSENTVYILSSVLGMIAAGVTRRASWLVAMNEKETMFADDVETVIRVLTAGRGSVEDVVEAGMNSIVRYFESREDQDSQENKERMMRSEHSGLTFPVSRVETILRDTCNCRITEYTPVFLAAALESLCTQWLTAAFDVTQAYDKKIITPMHASKALTSPQLAHLQKMITVLGIHIPNTWVTTDE